MLKLSTVDCSRNSFIDLLLYLMSILAYRLNSFNWLRSLVILFYFSNGQQIELFTVPVKKRTINKRSKIFRPLTSVKECFFFEKGCSNRQQIWLVDRLSEIYNLLSELKDGEWLNCSPRVFDFNHNLPEFVYILL